MVFIALGKYQALKVIEIHLLVGILAFGKACLKSGRGLGGHVVVDGLLTLE